MRRILALLLLGASLGLAAGCCKDCVRSKPSSPKVEEYPLPPEARLNNFG